MVSYLSLFLLCEQTLTVAVSESVEDEDEVLVALSEELGGFIEYVGGPQWGHVLLSPLENLAAIEEPVVRDKVINAPTGPSLFLAVLRRHHTNMPI